MTIPCARKRSYEPSTVNSVGERTHSDDISGGPTSMCRSTLDASGNGRRRGSSEGGRVRVAEQSDRVQPPINYQLLITQISNGAHDDSSTEYTLLYSTQHTM